MRPEIDRWAGFTRSADEALEHVESLRRIRDPEAFRAAMQTWAVKPDTLAFNGFAGQMLLNMLVKRSDDPYGLGGVLADGLSVPVDDDAAASKIRAVVEQVEAVRVRAQPAPRSAASTRRPGTTTTWPATPRYSPPSAGMPASNFSPMSIRPPAGR